MDQAFRGWLDRMRRPDEALTELRELVDAHATPDMSTAIGGLLLSRATGSAPEYSLTAPLLVVMAQGAKRLHLGDQVFEYRAGDVLVVTAELPVSGHFIGADPRTPALGIGIELRPLAITDLMLAARSGARPSPSAPAMSTGPAGPDLLDAVLRMVRLLDHPQDADVLAPLIEREILWRLLTGPHAAVVSQIGSAGSGLAHVNRTIRWIRENYAEPLRIAELASMAGMSPSAFHRHFRAVTAMSPLQFQKQIRLQEARNLLLSRAGDIAGVGHLVGYDSPTQFSREYRRMFGAPPGRDAARLSAPTALLP
ncbi:AraC family transcriptional regulator [Mycobacterium sp. ITM-2016-00317]|uniref:AraC family transcriptional regulator n=1 Tax=Mycobacterium sp. ITM-2016-00317 TaxID=2099694 RepID=UPI000D44B0AC|nr:AraC family transcriptional regulator [Mycobacterium sp. ITM-2016-00317]WNG89934.1 AraC family transcriptional regulator [Mycobacterium sp. ITM-2016-00317]